MNLSMLWLHRFVVHVNVRVKSVWSVYGSDETEFTQHERGCVGGSCIAAPLQESVKPSSPEAML